MDIITKSWKEYVGEDVFKDNPEPPLLFTNGFLIGQRYANLSMMGVVKEMIDENKKKGNHEKDK